MLHIRLRQLLTYWRHNFRCGYLCLILLSALTYNAAAEEKVITTPVYYPGHARQDDYYIELLQLALGYPCATRYQLLASGLDIPKKRAFDLMKAKEGVDIMYGSASTERLAQYKAIPFPILRGLMGLRIALVAEKNTLAQIHSLTALAQLRVGQFTTWSDTAILKANGFNVEPVSNMDGLYKMLALGRIDYFPRSVLEVQQNQQQYAYLNLHIDPHILLYYPTATYYYVAPDNQPLADALLCGLEQAQKDGSLNRMFERYYAGVLQQLNIDQRRVITLRNPLLPAGVPLQRPELWYPLPANQ